MANKETLKYLVDNGILQAWLNGETIQYRTNSNYEWVDLTVARPMFESGPNNYRIKPKPVLVPFTPQECFDLMLRKEIFVYAYGVNNDKVYIGYVGPDSVQLFCNSSMGVIRYSTESFSSFMNTYTFSNGDKCGKIIQE